MSVGLTSLASSESFDAVAGTHSKMTFGFGAEIQNIWKNVFAGVAYSPMSLDGERVFVDSGTVTAQHSGRRSASTRSTSSAGGASC